MLATWPIPWQLSWLRHPFWPRSPFLSSISPFPFGVFAFLFPFLCGVFPFPFGRFLALSRLSSQQLPFLFKLSFQQHLSIS
jgi:hypothetical protein